jgi:hypothetical protein
VRICQNPTELASVVIGLLHYHLDQILTLRIAQKPRSTTKGAAEIALFNCTKVILTEAAKEAACLKDRLHLVNISNVVHIAKSNGKR